MGKRINTGRKPNCMFWPDDKPGPAADKTGMRMGRLTIIQPIYIYRRSDDNGRVWYWLAECSCGNEVILCNITQTQSCGCLGKEKRAQAQRTRAENRKNNPYVEKSPGNDPKFDRFGHCTRENGEVRCKNYSACSDERGIERKRLSDRYVRLDGKCFELDDKDIQY